MEQSKPCVRLPWLAVPSRPSPEPPISLAVILPIQDLPGRGAPHSVGSKNGVGIDC